MNILIILLIITIILILLSKITITIMASYIAKYHPPKWYTFNQLQQCLQNPDFLKQYQAPLQTLYDQQHLSHDNLQQSLQTYLQKNPEAKSTHVLLILTPQDSIVKWFDRPSTHQIFMNALKSSTTAMTYNEPTHTYFVLITTNKNSTFNKMLQKTKERD